MMARHRFALAIITLVASLLFIVPLVKREVFTFRDHSDYFQPLRYYTAISLKQGRLPLWNPYSASGEPWLANPQTAVFYPPTLLFVVLPFETAYMLFLLFHLLVLGWGAYALFVRFAPPGAAMIGAVALMLCGPTLSLVDISNNLATFAWLPWVLWSAGCQPPGWRRPAIFLALAFLGGEPFFALLGAIAFVLIVRKLRDIAAVGLGAAALSAVQLIPFLEFVSISDRSGAFRREDILRDSVPLQDWLRLATPPHLNATGYDAALTQHFIPVVYVSLIIVALAVLGVVRGNRLVMITALVVLALCIAIGAGTYLPPIAAILSEAPLTLFRYPARLIPLGAFALITLAVAGLASLQIRRRWVELILVLAIIVDLVPRCAPLLETAKWSREIVPFSPVVGRTGKIIRLTDERTAVSGNRRPWISGYVNLYERRFDAWTAAPVAARRYTQLYERALAGPRLDLIDVLPVGWVLAERRLPARFVPFDRIDRVIAYRNSQAMPLATFWTNARGVADDRAAYRSLLEGSDARRLVVSPAAGEALSSAPAVISGVESMVLTPTFASVDVNAPREGVVMLTQQDAPGWRVFVDGKEQPKLLAHGIFRAVAVTSGRHDVLWRYRPASLYAGATITIFGLSWVLFFVSRFIDLKSLVKRRREKKFSSIDVTSQ